MTEKRNTKQQKLPSPPRRWGAHGDVVLEKLQRRQVELLLTDGSTLGGALVGYNEYTLTLKDADQVILVNKGHVVWMKPVTQNGKATAHNAGG